MTGFGNEPVTVVKGIGPELAKKFHTLGIKTVAELVDYFPRTYQDYSRVTAIEHLEPGMATIEAQVISVSGRYVRRGMHITEAVVRDQTGSVKLVWFNQPYRQQGIKKDTNYFISGDFGMRAGKFSMQNPSMELVSDFPINTARIVPIYRETKGLSSVQIRKALKSALSYIRSLPETLPKEVISKEKLVSYAVALEQVHFPESAQALSVARRRLGFEEVLQLTLAALLNKYDLHHERAVAIPFRQDMAQAFVSHLPFRLTDGQRQAVWQIYQDMERTIPMNRLVEGDVGSGKTAVAAMAAVMAMAQDYQVALMAPTELLARQHFETIHGLLKPLGLANDVGLLIGGLSVQDKKNVQAAIATGTIRFIIGTHALIQEKVSMDRLGLVIVDEQHRFGVAQRKALQAKAGHALHVLNMTATPIPRSLALTLYGELDISVIPHKPAGRLPIKTKIVSPNSRDALYTSIGNELGKGRQMFVVCPLVTESDAIKAVSVEKTYESMKTAFKTYRVGLLHGKMKPEEKDSVMQAFASHELDILVATTVIEVGVNVPNATVMLIENAERFGLAQMHQLRGRVGRSEHQGYCYLMMGDSAAPSKRLRALEASTDGFALAEMDLELRGPGAIYGSMQHGALDLRVATLTDVGLISAARAAAQSLIDNHVNLVQYPQLYTAVQKLRAVTNLN